MPEYLAPGVYVEEVSYRSNVIEGVGTTTTGFIGPCRFGPVDEPLDVVTSLTEFETIYLGGDQLEFLDPTNPTMPQQPSTNYLWQAARAFFIEGGTLLYVSRIFRPLTTVSPPVNLGDSLNPLWSDGCAQAASGDVTLLSRFPGAASNVIVTATVKASQNILSAQRAVDPTTGQLESAGSPAVPVYTPAFNGLYDHDVVVLIRASNPTHGKLYLATYDSQQQDEELRWRFQGLDESPVGATQSWEDLGLTLDPDPAKGDALYVLSVSIDVQTGDRLTALGSWPNVPLDPGHQTGGQSDSLFDVFSPNAASLSDARSVPLVFAAPATGVTGIEVALALNNQLADLLSGVNDTNLSLEQNLIAGLSEEIALQGGNDGAIPGAFEYEGTADPDQSIKTGLKQFEDIDEISIVAAPGSSDGYNNPARRDDVMTIYSLLIAHAESLRYRVAVLDSPPGMTISGVRRVRGQLDSEYAAFYYPWVTILDPITQVELNLPASGFVAGICGRSDNARGVWKAPANEVVSLALAFESTINKSQQELLNPEGINCFRFFEDRGYRLWGARTISSDPEWKYFNVRRYFAYLEHSIDKGTQWAVFEPNGYKLWDNVRRTIQDFLLNEWQQGALLGDKPEQAYFVRCDRTTMTQNDLDNGRLVCLIGVAPLYPAEFVIFRIGQWTADAKS